MNTPSLDPRVSRRALLGGAFGAGTLLGMPLPPARASESGPPILRYLRVDDEIRMSPPVTSALGIDRLRVTRVEELDGSPRYFFRLLTAGGEERGRMSLAADVLDRGRGQIIVTGTGAYFPPGVNEAVVFGCSRTLIVAASTMVNSWYVQADGVSFNVSGLARLAGATADPVRVGPVFQQHTFQFGRKSLTVHQPAHPIPALPITSRELRDQLKIRQKVEQFARTSGAKSFLQDPRIRFLLAILQDDGLLPHTPLLAARLARRREAPAPRGESWLEGEVVYLLALNTFLAM